MGKKRLKMFFSRNSPVNNLIRFIPEDKVVDINNKYKGGLKHEIAKIMQNLKYHFPVFFWFSVFTGELTKIHLRVKENIN